jgi:hypothetical protein
VIRHEATSQVKVTGTPMSKSPATLIDPANESTEYSWKFLHWDKSSKQWTVFHEGQYTTGAAIEFAKAQDPWKVIKGLVQDDTAVIKEFRLYTCPYRYSFSCWTGSGGSFQ